MIDASSRRINKIVLVLVEDVRPLADGEWLTATRHGPPACPVCDMSCWPPSSVREDWEADIVLLLGADRLVLGVPDRMANGEWHQYDRVGYCLGPTGEFFGIRVDGIGKDEMNEIQEAVSRMRIQRDETEEGDSADETHRGALGRMAHILRRWRRR